MRSGLERRLPALASATYRRFLLGAFIGTLGSWMQATAQGWLVLDLTDSPGLLGLTSAVSNAPTLFLSLFAGVLADQIDRRRLLVATQLAAAVNVATLALLTMTGQVEFWHVLVVAGIGGACGALAMPAFTAVVSTIVDRQAIGNAVALNSAQFNLGRIIGPTAAGAAIVAGGLALAFWANALALVVVAIAIASLRLGPASEIIRAEASVWANLWAGTAYIRRDRIIRLLVLLAAAPALFVLNYLALMPVFARDVLHVGAPGLGLLTAAVGVGALAGALSVAVLRPSGGSGRLLIAGLTVVATALIVFAVSRFLPLSLVALAVLGASQVAYYTTTSTLIQMLVPARLRGRVSSIYVLTSLGVIPVGNLLAGIVAERFGPTWALAGGGAATLAVVAWVVVRYPELQRLEARSIPAVD